MVISAYFALLKTRPFSGALQTHVGRRAGFAQVPIVGIEHALRQRAKVKR
jgi:hypothetical protein